MRAFNGNGLRTIPYRQGVIAVLLAVLWLWSSVLSAAWCVNTNGHEFNSQPDPGPLLAGERAGHHTAVCQGTFSKSPGAVSRGLPDRDHDSGSMGLVTTMQTRLPLLSGEAKAAPPWFYEVSTFTEPPLYLLYQKLLLPFTV